MDTRPTQYLNLILRNSKFIKSLEFILVTDAPVLFPGEELLNTFLKSGTDTTFNPDLHDVPKQLDVLKGWIYDEHRTNQGKYIQRDLLTNSMAHETQTFNATFTRALR